MTSDRGDALVPAAARNNAELCDAVARTHGPEGWLAPDAWTCGVRTPQYYPDAVTLVPDVDVSELLARIDCSPGASVKDSFAALDLSRDGFRILLTAEWIARAPGLSVTDAGSVAAEWSRVCDARTLADWEAAWSDDGQSVGRFRPALLDLREIVVLSGASGGEIVAGAILNAGDRIVGVSNLFSARGDLAGAWAGCLDEAASRFPGFAIVGYESGAELDVAHRAGFRSIGPLRVWAKP